eukprot:jgi/Astpho2/3575/Aster-x1156
MGQPVKNFCFLAEVPHLAGSAQLWPPLGGSGPQAPEVTQAQIDFLRQQGITGVISASGWGVPQDMLDASGLSLLRLDVPDFCSPSLSKVKAAHDFVRQQHQQGGKVLVHCTAGIGRTGTLLTKLEARLSAARAGQCSDWSSPDAMFDKAAQLVPVP